MRLCYADPPYIGQSKKHYSGHVDYVGEVDHVQLVKTLTSYDGWALSCHVNSLGYLLCLCPDTVRVAAWVKPFAFFKKGVSPSYCWEPVIFQSARTDNQRRKEWPDGPKFCRDWISLNVWGCTPAERIISDVKGRKRPEFSVWALNLMGAIPTDDLVDMFPGSGAVSSAFRKWKKYGGL